MFRHSRVTCARRLGRRGSALVVVLVFCISLAALALSAIYLTSSSSLLSRAADRDRDFRYAANAALAIGRSRVDNDPTALPSTGYVTLLRDSMIRGADGLAVQGLTVNLFIGPTGNTSGQFGRFASVVAEVRDPTGARFVRRLELDQESFAKFAYFTDLEKYGGVKLYFQNGDNIWGPVFTNDTIQIGTGGARFRDSVWTARTINNAGAATFDKGYLINQKPIPLPTNTYLSQLPALGTAGQTNFPSPGTGNETTVRMRIEFVAMDLNADGDSTDVDEGFLRVYTAPTTTPVYYVRGDYTTTKSAAFNCGDWHDIGGAGNAKFFPGAVHATTWFRQLMEANGMTTAAARAESSATLATIMQRPKARCYPGGDPHLVAIERNDPVKWTAAARNKGGDDTTFTAVGRYGTWTAWPLTLDPKVAATRPNEAAWLFPLYRGQNPGTKGVIYVNGTVGLSGVLRGSVTLYATSNIVLLDDLRYSADPASGRCLDILGLLTDKDIVVADNGLNGPQDVTSSGTWRSLDDTRDMYIHAVMMALGTSFRAQNYFSGPVSVLTCDGKPSGRGCLFVTGGIIQKERGPVVQSSSGGANVTGYAKRYSYDRCVLVNPPPYFPTTGRFQDNGYYELDPARFNVDSLFEALVPN
jgi:hypothetical protein